MSCYFRHLKEVFQEAGIEVDSNNRKRIDRAVHDLMGVEDCPATWRRLKQEILADAQRRRDFIQRLQTALR
jgi:hypothetical protein